MRNLIGRHVVVGLLAGADLARLMAQSGHGNEFECGEQIRGTIEWYDRAAIKVHRSNAPNILLLKDNIKYMYKENEDKAHDDD